MCFCSCPTCKHGRWGYRRMSLYLSLKYWATVHSIVWPFSCCKGNLVSRRRKTQHLFLLALGDFFAGFKSSILFLFLQVQVFLFILSCYSPTHGLSTTEQLKCLGSNDGKSTENLRLVAGWSSGNVANSVLPLHLSTVSYLNLEA